MSALAELRQLSVSERLLLVEDLWDSIAEDQAALPDHPSIIQELRDRKARFQADPASGIPWDVARQRIRNGGA